MAQFKYYKIQAWIFIIPQLLITFIFFIWPAIGALNQSFFYSDAFGIHSKYAGLSNYMDLFIDPAFIKALGVTFIIALSVTFLTMTSGLTLAVCITSRTTTQNAYKSLLIWPYAVAPAIAAILWRFLCHPALGWVTQALHALGVEFDYVNNPYQAMLVVILAASWQQFSYNFLFYFAALKAIPHSLIDAAIMDGAGAWRRFWDVIVPLLSPTTFFLLLMNLIYGFFDTFGIIQVLTHGGPGTTTTNLIYKVYEDGFVGMDLGGSSAQSVVLMSLIIVLSLLQFNFLEKKVHYE